MGDVAMIVPVISAFTSQYPGVKITVISRPFFSSFFVDIPNVTFFPVDLKARHKGFLGLLQLYSDLKRLNIDAVADLHNVLRSQILRLFFALSRKKIAFTNKGRSEKAKLTNAKGKKLNPIKPMVERHVDTFKKLGFNVDLSHPTFSKKAVLTSEILKITGEIPMAKGIRWIGIAPFAQYESKVYPQDLMRQVVDELALNKTNKIFLFGGGKKEVALLERLADGTENIINVAGKLNLKQELDLISNLDIMLSMDSGNSHIAAMLGVKVITLWGSTHPFAGFLPFHQPIENCIVSDRKKYPMLPTSVYGNKKVKGYEDAMRTISIESVIDLINKP